MCPYTGAVVPPPHAGWPTAQHTSRPGVHTGQMSPHFRGALCSDKAIYFFLFRVERGQHRLSWVVTGTRVHRGFSRMLPPCGLWPAHTAHICDIPPRSHVSTLEAVRKPNCKNTLFWKLWKAEILGTSLMVRGALKRESGQSGVGWPESRWLWTRQACVLTEQQQVPWGLLRDRTRTGLRGSCSNGATAQLLNPREKLGPATSLPLSGGHVGAQDEHPKT